jgi:hypothetical protein
MLLTKVETANVVANNSSINSNTLSVSVTLPPSPSPSTSPPPPPATPTRTPTPSPVGRCYRIVNTGAFEITDTCTYSYTPYGGEPGATIITAPGETNYVCVSSAAPICTNACTTCQEYFCNNSSGCTSNANCSSCT